MPALSTASIGYMPKEYASLQAESVCCLKHSLSTGISSADHAFFYRIPADCYCSHSFRYPPLNRLLLALSSGPFLQFTFLLTVLHLIGFGSIELLQSIQSICPSVRLCILKSTISFHFALAHVLDRLLGLEQNKNNIHRPCR